MESWNMELKNGVISFNVPRVSSMNSYVTHGGIP